MSVIHQQTKISDKSKWVAFVLCIIGFVGIAGLHEFYVGKTITGVLMFLTVGLLGFATLFHAISILLGNFKDNNWAFLKD